MERILKKIDPSVARSSFLLSLALIMGYVIVGVLAGGVARILYDVSLPVFFAMFWMVIYVTAKHCYLMRRAVDWLSKTCDSTRMTKEKRETLCAYFEGKAFGRLSIIVGVSTYVVSLSYFLVFTLPRVGWRLTELPYDKGFALGIPLTSVPLLMASELLHWALIRAVSTTAIWLALVSTLFLRQISREVPMRFAEFDHWEMKPMVDSAWSISQSLGVAGIFLFVWLPFLAVSALGVGAINTELAISVATAYGMLALGVSVCAIIFVRHMLASAKREVLSKIHNRLWQIYQSIEGRNKKRTPVAPNSLLNKLNLEVLTLEGVGATVEKRAVFPLSIESFLRLSASPLVYSGIGILREYFRSIYGF